MDKKQFDSLTESRGLNVIYCSKTAIIYLAVLGQVTLFSATILYSAKVAFVENLYLCIEVFYQASLHFYTDATERLSLDPASMSLCKIKTWFFVFYTMGY